MSSGDEGEVSEACVRLRRTKGYSLPRHELAKRFKLLNKKPKAFQAAEVYNRSNKGGEDKLDKLKKIAFATAASALILSTLATPAFAASGAEVVVDPGQEVTGSLTKDFNGAPLPQVEFSGGDLTAEVTGTISNDTLVWSLCVWPISYDILSATAR